MHFRSMTNISSRIEDCLSNEIMHFRQRKKERKRTSHFGNPSIVTIVIDLCLEVEGKIHTPKLFPPEVLVTISTISSIFVLKCYIWI